MDKEDIISLAKRSASASKTLSVAECKKINAALYLCADSIENNTDEILQSNENDMSAARISGMKEAMLDRLQLDRERIMAMAQGVRAVASQNDTLGKTLDEFTHKNGMLIRKVSVPLGVVAVIYEARPNVTSDAAAIALKSGNAVILRGGKEAINSNKAIAKALREGLAKSEIPEDSVILITDTSHSSAEKLMELTGYIDILIPRGGKALIDNVLANSKVPVIATGAGTCHTYVEKHADIEKAVKIVYNAKTSRPSVCNACECLLIDECVEKEFLPAIIKKLKEKNVLIKADEKAFAILGSENSVNASDDDWGREYNDYILAVKTVSDINEAIEHIARYGTKHSECIITEDESAAKVFLSQVDAAAVYHNVSTRFTDGGEFGLGAEIGISTQKLHARGPLGANELTTYKYIIIGNGQVR